MSWFEQTLKPWELINQGIQETKDAWNGEGKNRHDSFLGPLGRYTDPMTMLLGKKYANFVHGTIPRELNRAAEPLVQFGHNFNPLYWYGKRTGNETLNAIHDKGLNKGADIAGMVVGSIFGGGALGGAMGGGSSGGAGGSAGSYGSQFMQMPGLLGSTPQQPQQRPIGPSGTIQFAPLQVQRGLIY